MSSDTHLIQWNVEITRKWSPLYLLSNVRVEEPVPPVLIHFSAEFDSDDAAFSFEHQVREILEDMT